MTYFKISVIKKQLVNIIQNKRLTDFNLIDRIGHQLQIFNRIVSDDMLIPAKVKNFDIYI